MRTWFFLIFISVLYSQELDERYHSTEEIYFLLDSLNNLEDLNGWYRLDTIGYSTLNNIPIIAVNISDNVNVKEDEPRVLFIGQVHAEEILGIEIVISLMEDLLFPDPANYTHMNILKENLDIWFIPTANPDGLNVVHSGLDVSFRKNKRDLSPDGPIPNNIFDYDPSIGNDVDGVDLNRNFDFNWVFGDTFLEPDNSGYASHYDYYKGEEPFSENEAIAIRDLALDHDFVFSIVWHSSRSGNLSEKVFTSWKWEEEKESPDLGIMKQISDHFSGLIETEDGSSTYLSVYSGSRNGKLHDWFYRETGCFQYLAECGTANLQPDSILIENTISRTKPAMVYLMDRAIGYYADAAQITGIVYGSNGLPLEGAIIELLEHNGSVLRPRLTNEFGRYRRIVDVGTYNLLVKAEGHLPKEISVIANNSSITNRDLNLEPADIKILNLTLEDYSTLSAPLDGFLKNEFGKQEIQLSSGPNEFTLFEGNYTISVPMDDGNIPWERTIYLSENTSFIIPYQHGNSILISDSFPWEGIHGDWAMDGMVLKTQSSMFYNNLDSISNNQWMESSLLDVSGTNRVVLSIMHRYETEWDHDQISVSILDAGNNILGTRFWTGSTWMNSFNTDFITAVSDSEFTQIKIRLEFSPDETVNYRGWEIQEIRCFSINDQYLKLVDNGRSNFPNIRMVINGIYPNPSEGRFKMEIDNFPGGESSLFIYNLLGQEVKHVALGNLSPGKRFINFDLIDFNGRSLGSGMYFVKIQTPKMKAIEKCFVLKN
ncbi:MAG: hypothetical protein CMG60_09050 [Candidatus Marinimicrobia bacterium]|nr:hypothetical protein [Candidatus Neomarinimicrobiota bacterium]